MDQAGIKPRLRLGNKKDGGGVDSTGPHTVKFIKDRVVKGKNPETGKEREEVEYTFEEDGVEKTYNTPVKNKEGDLSYLVQRMADYNYGDFMILEMKRIGIKNYISITPIINDEIPTINAEMEDEPTGQNEDMEDDS